MQRVDRAYVLRTQELAEADLIVTLLTEHSGRVRGVARAARKSRKRFGGSLEPLTLVSARWYDKPGRDLQRIDALDLERSYARLQADPGMQATCAVLAEIAAQVAREEQAEPRVFRLLGAVLDALEAGLDPWIALRYFEYWTLRLHGLLPEIGSCAECGRAFEGEARQVVIAGRGVFCATCAAGLGAGRVLGRADVELLDRIGSTAPEAMGAPRGAARPGGAVEVLLRGTLEDFLERPLRTYRHLGLVAEPRPVEGNGR